MKKTSTPTEADDRGQSRLPTQLRRRAGTVYAKLAAAYPDAHCELEHHSPFELLVATILSAQCTDARVNMVTPALFARYPDPASLAVADRAQVERLIKTTGFFRNKAKSIRAAAALIVERHAGRVPDTMDELLELPGVGRKTANVVLGNAFGKRVGVVVDTHVARLSTRLGFVPPDVADPKKIETRLMALFPRPRWTMLSHLLIFHGRRICKARKPLCSTCPVARQCPRVGVAASA